jgi:hypothetical protein
MWQSIRLFLAALAKVWWALMSTAAFTVLSILSAISANGNKVTVIGTAVLAVFFFLVASFRAWDEQYKRSIAAEKMIDGLRPRLGLWADNHSIYLTHLKGEPAQFIEIDPLIKQPGNPDSTKLHFESIAFLSSAQTSSQRQLTLRIEIYPGKIELTDLSRATGVLFSSHSRSSASLPVTIRFRWNQEQLEERIMLTWLASERRFETKPL